MVVTSLFWTQFTENVRLTGHSRRDEDNPRLACPLSPPSSVRYNYQVLHRFISPRPTDHHLRVREEPRPGQRCRGKLLSEENLKKNCCTPETPCEEGEGDCDTEKNDGCKPGLKCGNNNCLKFGSYYHKKDDCCEIGEAIRYQQESDRDLSRS